MWFGIFDKYNLLVLKNMFSYFWQNCFSIFAKYDFCTRKKSSNQQPQGKLEMIGWKTPIDDDCGQCHNMVIMMVVGNMKNKKMNIMMMMMMIIKQKLKIKRINMIMMKVIKIKRNVRFDDDNRANEKSSATLQLFLEKESQHHQPPLEVSLSILAILLIHNLL